MKWTGQQHIFNMKVRHDSDYNVILKYFSFFIFFYDNIMTIRCIFTHASVTSRDVIIVLKYVQLR